MNFRRFLFTFCVLVIGVGCHHRSAEDAGPTAPNEALPPPTEAVLFATIQDNVKALENKDVDGVMATIHPRSPSYGSTRKMLEEMFSSIDLKFTLSDLRVISASPTEARVAFVQKTEKVGGGHEFHDNTIEGTHILRPDMGKWKIYSTVQN